ncbi:MAG: T9SS type A sorting domain-containing protein [candidate division Zixibacteria bacterium]|nr:T9SS type A sorting domain-containing protein [candidate division Zixibacteria bacterium]
MIKKIFALVILLSLSAFSAPADSECPPVPVFVECPGNGQGYISACMFDTVYLQVKAVHPNSEKCDPIRYHLEAGPGQVDEKTGVWSYFYEEGGPARFEVEISASIGQSGHRTEGDENCRLMVRVGISSPDIRVNLPGYPQVILTQAPGNWSIPLYVYDFYNCGYTLWIDSVSPYPAGELYLDDDENIIFKPLSQDADKRFYLKLKSQNQRFESRLTLVLDTRRRIPVPEFRPYSDTLRVPYCSYSNFYKFQAFDPEYNDSIGITYEIASGPGYIDKRSGYWSFYADKVDTGKAFEVEIAALYANSATSPYNNARFTVIVTGNEPPELSNADICGKELYLETLTDTISLFVNDVNECDPHIYFFEEISPQPAGTIEFGEQLQHKMDILINLAEPDRGKSFSVTAGVTDGPDTAYCSFVLNVDKTDNSFMIEAVHDVLPGKIVDVDLYGNSPQGFGGFDLLLGYDAENLTFLGANTDNSRLFTECGWEYFEYRFGPFGTSDSTAPSGQIRIVGIAESNNGNFHPSCFDIEDNGVLFTMKYLVSDDVKYDCAFIPISFFWYDCGDNTICNRIGTELYIADRVYDFIDGENWKLVTPGNVNVIEFPTYEGAMESCVSPGADNKPKVSRNIDFYNGGINVICNGDPDLQGDLNLNGIAYEIADMVLFRNYFLEGVEAFGQYYQGSIAASDINYDSIPLTVEDFVYMIRVIVGDVLPHPDTVNTCDDTASFSLNNGTVTVDFDSADSLGAVYLKVQGEVTPVLEAAGMDMEYHYDSAYTNIIIYSFEVGKSVHGGPLVSGLGDKPVVEAATVTYYGAKVTAVFDYLLDVTDESGDLPHDFSLGLNYPNPFNPATTFEYSLPYACEVELNVYNIRGQKVRTLVNQTMSAGRYTAVWHGVNDDGRSVASGVYFYRIRTDDFVATKKMILMK